MITASIRGESLITKKSLSTTATSVQVNRAAMDLLEAGLIAYQRGQPEQARLKFEQVITLEPEYAAAYFYLGNLMFEQDQLDLALESLEKAHAIDPLHEDLAELILSIKQLLATP